MPFRWKPREHLLLGRYALFWLIVVFPVASLIGAACAIFLWSLDRATRLREHHPWLLFLLPVAGVGIAGIYRWLGRSVERGNNLIVEQIHEPSAGVPARMTPLIFVTTVLTHLFGGSAGREGTAVQMGGSIASSLSRLFRRGREAEPQRILLMVGIAAGFGAVFGTPLTGAVFAMEVLAVGRISYEAMIPCLIAGVFGDWACGVAGRPLGVTHTDYRQFVAAPHLDWFVLAKVALASVGFGLAAHLFAELTHGLTALGKSLVRHWAWRPVIGGLIVIGLTCALGTRDFLGLGIHPSPGGHISITTAFARPGADAMSWFWKILFTAVTLSAGFKGGEVTPLFFIGSTLGNTLGKLLHAPADLFAVFPAAGFVAVFAGATNTPLACTLMGIELFGGESAIYMATACFVAYFFSGHSGIYSAQRIGTPKHRGLACGESLESLRRS